MARLGCSMVESWEILVAVFQNTGLRLQVVAETIMAAVTGKEPVPRSLLGHLAAAMSRRQVTEHDPGWTG
ncbi:hypothetical protein SUDANB176_06072 [Streptomyces sp. enrichment culture]|uniref:hypothetical protein n=1 Tax=Streptomyces sp. enrichment culture TaxID=1795815 RepID=UPI003F546798